MSGTIAASCACGSGTKTRRIPRWAAASTIGSTPGTDRSPPLSVSSPMKTEPVTSAWGSWPSALSTASAMARSKWVPRFGRSLGESRMVIRLVAGQWRRVLWIAIRHRWGDSLSDTSARPTMVRPACPGDTSAWTSTR